MKLQSRCWLGLQPSKCMTGSGKSASIISHSCGWQAGTLVSPHMGLSTRPLECSNDMAVPQNEWSKRKHGWSCIIFYSLVSEVTYHYSHSILLITQVSLIQCRSELPKGTNTRRQGPLEAILKSGYNTTWIISYTCSRISKKGSIGLGKNYLKKLYLRDVTWYIINLLK